MSRLCKITAVFILFFSYGLSAEDGCGSGWNKDFVRDSYGNANFTNSCNLHDACYENCGGVQENCDDVFYKNMEEECNKAYNHWIHKVHRDACIEIAKVYYSSVKNMGNYFWVKAQESSGC